MTKQLDTQDWGKERSSGWKRNGVFSIAMALKAKALEDVKKVSAGGKEVQRAKPWGFQCLDEKEEAKGKKGAALRGDGNQESEV